MTDSSSSDPSHSADSARATAPTSSPDSKARRDKLYGRRKGRPLRTGRQHLIEHKLPPLTVSLPETPGERLEPEDLFPAPRRALWVEIGFGGGEHLAAQAEAHPEVGFIGSEFFINGIASLLAHLEQRGLENVRLFPDDGRKLLAALPDGSVERAFVLFPDPWPKKRHAGRRFIQQGTLDELARLIPSGGELRLASDDPVMRDWMVIQATGHPAFRWLARRPQDWRQRPADWPLTRYEQKAIREGRQPSFLRLARR